MLALPKNPTSMVFATVVVMEGAVTEAELALTWPPETLMGALVSTLA